MQIALIGSTLSRARAPYDDPSWTIWAHACTHALRGMPGKRVDAWFDVHTPAVRRRPKTWDPRYHDWLASSDRAPIYLQEADEAIPHSRTFPREAIVSWATAVGLLPDGPYFTSSLSWMIAHALYAGARTIGIWGCTFAQRDEYRVQRPCAEYWIAAARAFAVPVIIDGLSPLCRSRHVYGYSGPRRDLQDTAIRPRPLMVLPPGVDPPARVIPEEIQALIRAQEELYAQVRD